MPETPPSSINSSNFFGRGKLMLTGEYLVLDGALSLAVPTKLGQSLQVSLTEENDVLHWRSSDHTGAAWFEHSFSRKGLESAPASIDKSPKGRVARLLHYILRDHPLIWPRGRGLRLHAHLEFDRQWGLGSSATLAYVLAAWSASDPYLLNQAEFGGSGYDIACAGAEGPIVYKLDQGKPVVADALWSPDFIDELWLVHLGEKRDSREGIKDYRARAEGDLTRYAAELDGITKDVLAAKTSSDFAEAMRRHEALIAYVTHQERIGKSRFADFSGTVKSLGAWGGDFVLAIPTGQEDVPAYFASKGLEVCLPAKQVLSLGSGPSVFASKPSYWPVFLYGPLAEPRMDNEWLTGHDFQSADLLDYAVVPGQAINPVHYPGSFLAGTLVYLAPEEIRQFDLHPQGRGFRRTQATLRVGETTVRAQVWVQFRP